MENYDRKNQMKEIHRRKKANTEIKVNLAIERLLKENIEINFNVVSKYANVSKATLYNHKKIRNKIEELRKQNIQTNVIKGKNDGKNAIIESLKRKIKKLENENESLKNEIKVLYKKIYENI
ncbi:DUF6262 family protein [Staphylococcus felis]|uniref:DUF6262 family protein n=1 Tax=Staphylococcus felis TaxID=46127 RepID=UPI000E287761|nr:DUF6262 family protein [Staphylococcus felis]REI04132.1 transposase [Staphylococcus felis]